MINKERALGLLGLANSSGSVIVGDSVFFGLPMGRVKLVIVAADAGVNNAKKAADKSKYYQTEVISFASKDELAHALGRTSVAVIGITDGKLAIKLKSLMKDGEI